MTLAEARTKVQALLATAVDSSTWTTAIIDQALRQALMHYSEIGPVSESTFTVSTAGYTQDISSLGAILKVLAVAFPWDDDIAFDQQRKDFRTIGTSSIRVEGDEPAVGDDIRIRWRQLHTIDTLDSATSTTIPTIHDVIVVTYAAAEACRLRLRQISENPAIPRDAIQTLPLLANQWESQAIQWMQAFMKPATNPSWVKIGL